MNLYSVNPITIYLLSNILEMIYLYFHIEKLNTINTFSCNSLFHKNLFSDGAIFDFAVEF